MNYKIDAVMIDTSIYHKNRCDFEGITRSIIPMLLQLLEANNITLLTHPVLESEIRKHIGESEFFIVNRNIESIKLLRSYQFLHDRRICNDLYLRVRNENRRYPNTNQ